jgi:hypothetical protein
VTRLRTILIAALSLLCADWGQSRTISWGTSVGDILLDSSGSALDAGMIFELGSFGTFVPTGTNLDLWAANWKPFDRAVSNDGWSAPAQFVTSYATLQSDGTSSSSPPLPSFTFATGEQAYFWAYKSSQAFGPGLEWALVTNDATNGTADDWKFPEHSGQGSLTLDWRLSDATTVVFGALNNVQGPGVHSATPGAVNLQTHTIDTTCAISAVSPAAGTCNTNNTLADASDDYHLATVTITFANRPSGGTLALSGPALHSGTYSVGATSTSTSTTHIFANVKLRATGTALTLTAAFSAQPACFLTVNAPSVPSCGGTCPTGYCRSSIVTKL